MATSTTTYSLIDIAQQEDKERAKAALWFLRKIEKGRKSGEEEGWLSEEEIKEYFVTLSLKDIELLHGQEINRYCAKDDSLYEACEHLDIKGIKASIKNGANIHAINEDGESPIYKCVEAVKDFC